jgi:hypothetical protein
MSIFERAMTCLSFIIPILGIVIFGVIAAGMDD